jgi:hypothetical protein
MYLNTISLRYIELFSKSFHPLYIFHYASNGTAPRNVSVAEKIVTRLCETGTQEVSEDRERR